MSHLYFKTDMEKRQYQFRDRCSRYVELSETISLPDSVSVTYLPEIKMVSGTGASLKGGFEVTANNTLLGWLKKGKTVECSVETPMGKILMFAQNEKVRMEGIPYFSIDSMGGFLGSKLPNPPAIATMGA